MKTTKDVVETLVWLRVLLENTPGTIRKIITDVSIAMEVHQATMGSNRISVTRVPTQRPCKFLSTII